MSGCFKLFFTACCSENLLDSSLKKDKVIENKLNNYNEDTNAIGIMCCEYKPTVILNCLS
jgi:hypothetical protein